jgi:tRNA-dihydrouridine synthase
MITIHGRSYKQSHNGSVDREYIYKIKSELANTPVVIIGNGGLNNYQDGLDALGNLDGVMW